MSAILEEFEDTRREDKSKGSVFYLKIFSLLAVVVGFGVYVGDMLFGKSSLDVLLDLQSDRQILEKSVDSFKRENAVLQKEYFELKGLDPDSKGF